MVACGSTGQSRDLLELTRAEVALPETGRARLALDDFGGLSMATLESGAIPYKVVAAALVIDEEARQGRRLTRGDIPAVFRRFGFLSTHRLANWSGPRPRSVDRPLGLISGVVRGKMPFVAIEVANLGCAGCHAGTTYDASGFPTGEAWVGLPNTSVNLEAFSQSAYASLKRAIRQPDTLQRRVEALFPEMSRSERFTLRHLLLRRIRKTFAARAATLDAPNPFSVGGPGLTNGVAALKAQLGLLARDRMQAEYGFTSIPDLASRGLRSSLLYDGTYAPRGAVRFAPRSIADASLAHVDSLAPIVAFFTVPTMGMRPADAEKAIPRVREALNWLATEYQPPPFPGVIDENLAHSGGDLFALRCASCHGRYDDRARPPRPLVWFPNALSPQSAMKTDSARWAALDSAALARLAATPYAARYMATRRTGGYVAPILSGLWATAPYLHNGSVPTLWQLMTPAERPERFLVGGHRLDYATVGIAGGVGPDGVYRYPAGYIPWSEPELYDTRLPGLGNRGHEHEFTDLTDAQKRALLEYLKGL